MCGHCGEGCECLVVERKRMSAVLMELAKSYDANRANAGTAIPANMHRHGR